MTSLNMINLRLGYLDKLKIIARADPEIGRYLWDLYLQVPREARFTARGYQVINNAGVTMRLLIDQSPTDTRWSESTIPPGRWVVASAAIIRSM